MAGCLHNFPLLLKGKDREPNSMGDPTVLALKQALRAIDCICCVTEHQLVHPAIYISAVWRVFPLRFSFPTSLPAVRNVIFAACPRACGTRFIVRISIDLSASAELVHDLLSISHHTLVSDDSLLLQGSSSPWHSKTMTSHPPRINPRRHNAMNPIRLK